MEGSDDIGRHDEGIGDRFSVVVTNIKLRLHEVTDLAIIRKIIT